MLIALTGVDGKTDCRVLVLSPQEHVGNVMRRDGRERGVWKSSELSLRGEDVFV